MFRRRNLFVLGLITCCLLLISSLRNRKSKQFPSGVHSIKQNKETSNNNINNEENAKIIILLYWSTFFGEKLIKQEKVVPCKTPCMISSERSRAGNASIFLLHAGDPYPLPPAEYNNTTMVLYSQENPIYNPMLSNPGYVEKFNYLMTYRADCDFFFSTFGIPTLEPKPIPFENKTGLVPAAFSNCEPVRTAYLKELMKHIKVDSYGACLNNKNGLPKRYQGDFKGEKEKLLKNYKFTTVFQNQDCDYFVDDQLTHALTAGTIPVFLGIDKVDELLGGNLRFSIIKAKDFESPKKLADYLLYVASNKSLYNRYLTWKYEGYQFSSDYLSTPQGKRLNVNCQMCEMIDLARRNSGKLKKKGSVKAEYCSPRKLETWLPKL